MKFTKEDAIERLKRELTNNGRKPLRISETTLEGTTEDLISDFANDETGLPEFCDLALKYVSRFNNNIRNDVSSRVREELSKSKNEEKSEDKVNPKDDSKDTDSENPELKSLLDRIAVLEKDKAENEKKATIAQKRKDVVAKLKEKGVKDEEWLNDFLSEVNIGEDFDVDSKADSWLKLYNKSKANGGNPVAPANPSGGGSNEYLNSIKAAADIAKRERAVIENK